MMASETMQAFINNCIHVKKIKKSAHILQNVDFLNKPK